MGAGDDIHTAVAEFTASATRFVELVRNCETTENADADALVADIGHALSEMYATAMRLPEVELPDEDIDVYDDDDVPTAEFFDALDQLGRVVDAAFDWAWLAQFDEIDRTETLPLLADELAETYHDVAGALAMLARCGREGEPVWSTAVWHVRFDFWSHWGHHAVSAMKPLHAHFGAGGLRPVSTRRVRDTGPTAEP